MRRLSRPRKAFRSNAIRAMVTLTPGPDQHGAQLANAMLLNTLTSSPAQQGAGAGSMFRPNGNPGDWPTGWTAPVQVFTTQAAKIQNPQLLPGADGIPQTAQLAAAMALTQSSLGIGG